jgi:hypothetical protein
LDRDAPLSSIYVKEDLSLEPLAITALPLANYGYHEKIIVKEEVRELVKVYYRDEPGFDDEFKKAGELYKVSVDALSEIRTKVTIAEKALEDFMKMSDTGKSSNNELKDRFTLPNDSIEKKKSIPRKVQYEYKHPKTGVVSIKEKTVFDHVMVNVSKYSVEEAIAMKDMSKSLHYYVRAKVEKGSTFEDAMFSFDHDKLFDEHRAQREGFSVNDEKYRYYGLDLRKYNFKTLKEDYNVFLSGGNLNRSGVAMSVDSPASEKKMAELRKEVSMLKELFIELNTKEKIARFDYDKMKTKKGAVKTIEEVKSYVDVVKQGPYNPGLTNGFAFEDYEKKLDHDIKKVFMHLRKGVRRDTKAQDLNDYDHSMAKLKVPKVLAKAKKSVEHETLEMEMNVAKKALEDENMKKAPSKAVIKVVEKKLVELQNTYDCLPVEEFEYVNNMPVVVNKSKIANLEKQVSESREKIVTLDEAIEDAKMLSNKFKKPRDFMVKIENKEDLLKKAKGINDADLEEFITTNATYLCEVVPKIRGLDVYRFYYYWRLNNFNKKSYKLWRHFIYPGFDKYKYKEKRTHRKHEVLQKNLNYVPYYLVKVLVYHIKLMEGLLKHNLDEDRKKEEKKRKRKKGKKVRRKEKSAEDIVFERHECLENNHRRIFGERHGNYRFNTIEVREDIEDVFDFKFYHKMNENQYKKYKEEVKWWEVREERFVLGAIPLQYPDLYRKARLFNAMMILAGPVSHLQGRKSTVIKDRLPFQSLIQI